jgi:tRNA threonylcarbamoyladenosine biosynthesis protein TsaE
MFRRGENIGFMSTSADETIAAGRRLARILKDKDLIILTGPLGSGKTTLIKGIAAGFDIPEEDVRSASFTMINEYIGTICLFHFDLYRMKDTSELYQLGWDDYLLRDGIVVVEWGEKAAELLPGRRIHVFLDILSDINRKISIDFIN